MQHTNIVITVSYAYTHAHSVSVVVIYVYHYNNNYLFKLTFRVKFLEKGDMGCNYIEQLESFLCICTIYKTSESELHLSPTLYPAVDSSDKNTDL